MIYITCVQKETLNCIRGIGHTFCTLKPTYNSVFSKDGKICWGWLQWYFNIRQHDEILNLLFLSLERSDRLSFTERKAVNKQYALREMRGIYFPSNHMFSISNIHNLIAHKRLKHIYVASIHKISRFLLLFISYRYQSHTKIKISSKNQVTVLRSMGKSD
jgi:hypothetical protein